MEQSILQLGLMSECCSGSGSEFVSVWATELVARPDVSVRKVVSDL